jgi:hypothetical protein
MGSRAREVVGRICPMRKQRGKRVELRIALTRKLTKAQRAELDAETERIGTFLSLEPVVTFV